MVVKRIVTDIATSRVQDVQAFYTELFDLSVVMDQGWIVTLASQKQAPVQLSIASQGGSGTDVPDMSIEVDDVDAVHAKAQASGYDIVYPLTDEPWRVRRFFLRDPAGKVLNVLTHID